MEQKEVLRLCLLVEVFQGGFCRGLSFGVEGGVVLAMLR